MDPIQSKRRDSSPEPSSSELSDVDGATSATSRRRRRRKLQKEDVERPVPPTEDPSEVPNPQEEGGKDEKRRSLRLQRKISVENDSNSAANAVVTPPSSPNRKRKRSKRRSLRATASDPSPSRLTPPASTHVGSSSSNSGGSDTGDAASVVSNESESIQRAQHPHGSHHHRSRPLQRSPRSSLPRSSSENQLNMPVTRSHCPFHRVRARVFY